LQSNIFKINQLSRFAGSSGPIPTFRNEYQKKIARIMGNTVPMVGFRERMEAFSFGNNTLYNDVDWQFCHANPGAEWRWN
jgi:two-component response regulator (ARR-B family)